MDWHEWHEAYADPSSELSARLGVVRRFVGQALDALRPGPVRILSLCAGEGRDVLPELAARPDLDADVVLVELDPTLAGRAEARAAELGLESVQVRVADAGATAAWADLVPVDLLLLCGIFGNVAEADIRGTLAAARLVLRPGGWTVWTRGSFTGYDLRPNVREWSVEAGLEEVAFDGDPAPHGVGLYRSPAGGRAPDAILPDRLFTFIR